MPELIIVRATTYLADDIGYVHALSWQAAYKGLVPDEFLAKFTPEKRSKKFRESIPSSSWENYIAYLGKKPMGLLTVGASTDEDLPKGTGEVGAIYLLPQYWGTGCGKSLMDFGISRLKRMGFGTVALWVLEENRRARGFYEKYGFSPDGSKAVINLGKPLFKVRYRLEI